MNTDAHHSGKAHSTHDITGSPTTHGSYTHSHKYSTHDITGSPATHSSYIHSHEHSTHDITGSRSFVRSFVLFLLNVLRCQKHIRDNL